MRPNQLLSGLNIFLLMISSCLSAQEVQNIRTEQSGDFIKISYQIVNSTPDQVYKVQVLCSINGGMNSEVRSISGDVGSSVAGGKEDYWALWDVLKDVDELSSAEFVVRAELISGSTEKVERDWSTKKIHVQALIGRSEDILYGGRVAYCGKYGVSVRFAMGKMYDDFVYEHEGILTDVSLIISGIDFTMRLVNSGSLQIHYMLGGAYCTVKAGQGGTSQDMTGDIYREYIGIDMGFLLDIGSFSLSTGVSLFPPREIEPAEYDLRPATFDMGIGFRF